MSTMYASSVSSTSTGMAMWDMAAESPKKLRIIMLSRSLVCWMSRNGSHRYTGYAAWVRMP
jgi:hypothetical protein